MTGRIWKRLNKLGRLGKETGQVAEKRRAWGAVEKRDKEKAGET